MHLGVFELAIIVLVIMGLVLAPVIAYSLGVRRGAKTATDAAKAGRGGSQAGDPAA